MDKIVWTPEFPQNKWSKQYSLNRILDEPVIMDMGLKTYLIHKDNDRFENFLGSIDSKNYYIANYWHNHIFVWEKLYCVKNWHQIVIEDKLLVGFGVLWNIVNISANMAWNIVVEMDNWELYIYDNLFGNIAFCWLCEKWEIYKPCLTIDDEKNIYYLANIDRNLYIYFNWTPISLNGLVNLDAWEPPYLEVIWPRKFKIIYWTDKNENDNVTYKRHEIILEIKNDVSDNDVNARIIVILENQKSLLLEKLRYLRNEAVLRKDYTLVGSIDETLKNIDELEKKI